MIADFFNVHVSEWNLGKDSDGSWKYMPAETDNTSHPASISKQDFDNLFHPPTSENEFLLPDEIRANEETKDKRSKFITELTEKVQQHNLHKPNPYGPPLPNQKCSKKKPVNQKIQPWETNNYCAKGYPKPFCQYKNENIQQDPYRPKLYKLNLERNDRTINNYNPIISLATLANIDIQPVLTYAGLLGYCTKYATKNDNPDLFRDFRDDTGKPVDAGPNVNRTEIPVRQEHVPRLVSKMLNDTIKYNMVSAPELHHHLLNLPPYFSSRSFRTISLQPSLNKLLTPLQLNDNPNQQSFVKDDEISLYEKRCSFEVSNPIAQIKGGDNPNIRKEKKDCMKEKIRNMSMFLFYTKFFVKNKLICKKTKAPIILFKPYISPKKKNNPKYHQYMVLTLLAYTKYEDRNSIISLNKEDLEKTFNEFLNSNI